MKREKFYKWTVEFEVAASWVADGFDLTDERAHDMISGDLTYAYGHELRAKVIKAPAPPSIRKEQGHAK